MKQAYGYIRVSTDRQEKAGNGLEAQSAAIREYAEKHGYTLVEVVSETASGKLTAEQRPVLQRVLRQSARDKSTVLVAKLDRLSRSVAVVSDLIARGVRFVVCEYGESVDTMILHIFAAVAQKERELIGQRTKAALQALKAKGKKLGNPHNIKFAGRLGADAVIKQADDFAERMRPSIERMRAQKMTLQAIARELNSQAVPTPRGGSWTAKSVCNLIQRWS